MFFCHTVIFIWFLLWGFRFRNFM